MSVTSGVRQTAAEQLQQQNLPVWTAVQTQAKNSFVVSKIDFSEIVHRAADEQLIHRQHTPGAIVKFRGKTGLIIAACSESLTVVSANSIKKIYESLNGKLVRQINEELVRCIAEQQLQFIVE